MTHAELIAPATLTDPQPLTIAGREFRSRLMVGTGKYASNSQMIEAIDASGAEVVTVAVMPLASPIGSGLGMLNPYAIRTIKQRLSVPVIVDAGVGTASDACIVMEQGVDGILMNTGIAAAQDPVRMASAMKSGVEAGRNAYLAGRMPRREVAVPSSPTTGMLGS